MHHDAQRGLRAPIVMLTARAMQGDRERFLAAGADGHVTKPIQMEQLEAEIGAVMAATHRNHEIFEKRQLAADERR
jgi:CheY-like chemotaxis protein